MSAYDMAVSDAVYGPCARYIDRQRLGSMLDHEYPLLFERLGAERGRQNLLLRLRQHDGRAQFRPARRRPRLDGHPLPTRPVRRSFRNHFARPDLNRENVREQEAIGALGVNLIHGAFYLFNNPPALVASLLDNLTHDRIEIDMLRVSGQAFPGIDNG